MRILVTGSSGILGSEIVRQLSKHDLITIDITPSETTKFIIDVKDRDKIFKITKDVDVIIHTAAVHGKHVDLNYPKMEFIRTNIEGTLNLLEAAVYNNIKKIIFTSTTSIYGKAMVDSEKAVWVDEDLVPMPRDIYDISKLAAENLCLDFSEKYNIPAFVFRISRFMDEPINDIANYRLYRGIDVRDGAAGHILSIESGLTGFNLFNLSNDTLFKKEDLIKLKTNPKEVILKYYKDVENIYKKRKWIFPETIDRVYVIDKAKKLLGYKPEYNYYEFITGYNND